MGENGPAAEDIMPPVPDLPGRTRTLFRRFMKAVVLLAVLAGLCIAVQTNLTAVAQRALGAPVLVAISGLTTSLTALVVALALAKPDFTGRSVGYAVGSGMLGALIVGAIAIAAAQGGVARALSLVIASQLVFGLILDALGVFGDGPDIGALKVLGVVLIIAGGVLVVRF
jgi:bacterial/archaeal transporter family-2 protein